MKLSQILEKFKESGVRIDPKKIQSISHGGQDKKVQQFDFRFKKDGSWHDGSFTVTWAAQHIVEHSQKTDATSDDGMRSLYHDFISTIKFSADDPTISYIYCRRPYHGYEVIDFIKNI